jgi:O-antigen/teichoic acid export membrane protein
MEKHDYAQYSIAVAFVAATTLVAEAGLNSVLMSRGAELRDRKSHLDTLFTTAMRFRFIVGSPLIIIGSAFIAALLVYNEMPIPIVAVSTLIVLAILYTTMTSGTLLTFHRLNLSTELIQRTNLAFSAARLLIIAGIIWTFGANVPIVLTVSLACALGTTFVYRKTASRTLNFKAARSKSDWGAFSQGAKRTLPMTVMLVLSEQSILVFLSFFGTPEVIANVSALSRFSIAFVMINLIIADIGAPLIARTQSTVAAIGKKFGIILSIYFGLAGVLVVAVNAAGPFLLNLLGSKYSGLEMPLLIIAAGSAVLNIGYAFSSMNQARGWTKYSWTYLPLITIWAVLGLVIFDLTTTLGAAAFMATQALPSLSVQIIRFVSGMKRLSKQRASLFA